MTILKENAKDVVDKFYKPLTEAGDAFTIRKSLTDITGSDMAKLADLLNKKTNSKLSVTSSNLDSGPLGGEELAIDITSPPKGSRGVDFHNGAVRVQMFIDGFNKDGSFKGNGVRLDVFQFSVKDNRGLKKPKSIKKVTDPTKVVMSIVNWINKNIDMLVNNERMD